MELAATPAAHPFAAGVGLPSDLEETLEQEAMKNAEKGAALARSVGFDATALVERGIPVWSRIVQAADDHDASVIVMGRTDAPASRALLGSVPTAVSSHGDRPVLIVHAAAADRAA